MNFTDVVKSRNYTATKEGLVSIGSMLGRLWALPIYVADNDTSV